MTPLPSQSVSGPPRLQKEDNFGDILGTIMDLGRAQEMSRGGGPQ
jgi:hypothetical protein